MRSHLILRGKAQSHVLLIALLVTLALLPAAPVGAQGEALGEGFTAREQQVMASMSFLNGHPDLKYRTEGWRAFEAGRFAEARNHLKRAARYADKMSQAMLAEMLWEGRGGAVDRPAAYAWADIAAERGYPWIVAVRERYWAALDDDGRERAIAIGQELLKEYGDAVAKRRMSRHLRQSTRMPNRAGNPMRDAIIEVPGPGGMPIRLPGKDFFASRFWDPREYHAWVDATWSGLPQGRVEVGDMQADEDADEQP